MTSLFSRTGEDWCGRPTASNSQRALWVALTFGIALTGCGGSSIHPADESVNVPVLSDAAYTTQLGVFSSSAPCSQNDWQYCAGNTSAPNAAPLQMGSPMAQPGLGIPLGGIGAGSFMVNRAGTFGPWNMGGSINGNYENRILPQAAFHIREQVGQAQSVTRTLAVNTSQFGSVMPAWSALSKGSGTYSALYPFGKIDFGNVTSSTAVSLTFWTPIVANNENRSSQPLRTLTSR